MSYFVIEESTLPKLMNAVDNFLILGWRCVGGVCYVPAKKEIVTGQWLNKSIKPAISEQYIQAMIKE